jgi:hypothetical protein
MEEAKVLHVDDIDFKDDGNRDSIFTVEASEEDIQNFEEGNVETVFEDNEYGGTFGVYKLPTGEYMYAFPDAEAYAKAPKGVKIEDSAASMSEMNKMDNTPKMEAEEGSEEETSGGVTIASQEELDTYVEENGLVINGNIEYGYNSFSGEISNEEELALYDDIIIKGNLFGGPYVLGDTTIEGDYHFSVDPRSQIADKVTILTKKNNSSGIEATQLAKNVIVNSPQDMFTWGSDDQLILPDNLACQSRWCMLSADNVFENIEKATISFKGEVLYLYGSFMKVDDNTFREFAKRLKVEGNLELFNFPSYSEEMTDEEIRQIFPNVTGEIKIRSREIPTTKTQPDSAASMNEMNKMKRKSRM